MRTSDRPTAIALIAAACAAGVLATSSPLLRMPFGILLTLYLPGAAVLQAAFRSAPGGLTGLVFAAGLSIVTTILCGFALHGLGAMTREGWAIALWLATLAACCAALLARRPRWSKRALRPRPKLRPVETVMFVAAVALAGTAAALARQQALARSEFAYTEFWMIPERDDGLITLGLKNAETAPSTYDVEVSIDGSLAHIWRSIPLAVGETWRAEFTLPAPPHDARGVEAWLFKDGNHNLVYRRVWLRPPAED